jgi:TDG/mug DNA glycosylase family protein
MDIRHHSFAPHADGDTRLLILGSLPGARSLAQHQYYAHPQNKFWRLLETVAATPLASLDYALRLKSLADHNIGLWDVIQSAARRTSSDSDIKQAVPQDLRSIFTLCPKLEAIAFNGGKASQLGRRILGEKGELLHLTSTDGSPKTIRLIDLPSSSAANTASFATKLEHWARLAPYVRSA